MADTRQALLRGQFIPYFQPIVVLRTGELRGFEILARWRHPQHGLVSADQFICLAEEQHWIDDLTLRLLQKAFEEASSLPERLTLWANISCVQFRGSTLPGLICRAAKGTGFSPCRLVLEITESALIDDLEHTAHIVRELKEMGCRLALDDFGTGRSSLLHLQPHLLDALKVDRSFVSSMTELYQVRKIVAGLVGLGRSVGLMTVAEGIETREQAEAMIWLGCELGQGWYFGRPLPAEDLASVVTLRRQRLSAEQPSPWKEVAAADSYGTLSQVELHRINNVSDVLLR